MHLSYGVCRLRAHVQLKTLSSLLEERCDKLAVCNVQLRTEIKERCDKLAMCNVQLGTEIKGGAGITCL